MIRGNISVNREGGGCLYVRDRFHTNTMQETNEDLSEATACRSKFVYVAQGKQDSDV